MGVIRVANGLKGGDQEYGINIPKPANTIIKLSPFIISA